MADPLQFIALQPSPGHIGDFPWYYTETDPYDDERVRNNDRLLLETLRKIFHGQTGEQIQDLLLRVAKPDFVIRLIVGTEPALQEALSQTSRLSLLWITVFSSYQKSAELLVRSGADVNVRCNVISCPLLRENGVTILHALLQVYPSPWIEQFARLVIEHGANLEARDSNYQTVLLAAVEQQRLSFVQLLLEKGANVNATDDDGETALFTAADSDQTELVTLLIKSGADIDRKSNDGSTVMHNACNYFDENTVKLLVSLDADLFVEDLGGVTPFSMIPNKRITNPSVKVMLQTLALRKACPESSAKLAGEGIMEHHTEMWYYYQKCIAETHKAKSERFIYTCTFFELLTKCQCRIAILMRNPEFVRTFDMHDLSIFIEYAKDMRQAVEAAKRFYKDMLKLEELINEAFNYVLVPTFVTMVARYMLDCECKVRSIVERSRGSTNR